MLPKLLKKSNLKWPGGKFEAKYCLQRQSWPKYFRQTVVFLLFFKNFLLVFFASICLFESGKCGKEEKKLQKFEYLENEKSFSDDIKKHFS